MAGLDFLGAVGKGVMVGADQIRRQESHDATLASQKEAERMRAESLKMQQAQLEMNTEAHGLKVDAAKTLQAEVARAERLSTLQNDLVKQYPDANPYQRQQMLVDKGVEANLFRGDELEKAHATREALRNKIGVQAYDAVLAGDIKPLQMILGEQGVAARYSPDKRSIILTTAEGEKPIGVDGLLQMEAMAGARQRAAELAKSDQDFRAKEAKINADEALAGYRDRMPNAGGRGSSTSGKTGGSRPNSPDDFDPLKLIKEFKDTFSGGDMGGVDGAPVVDLEKGAEFYARIVTRNPEVTASPDGKTIAANMARALAAGQGRLSPEISPDGTLRIVANVGPNTYVVEDGVTEERLMLMPGLDGKPIAKDSSEVGKMYLQALDSLAKRDPVAFQGAVASRDPKGLEDMKRSAANGDADAKRALALLPVIQRADQYARTIPIKDASKTDKKPAPTFTDKEKAAAARFGVDADKKGIGDYIGQATDYVAGKVGRAIDSADMSFVQNTLKKIRSTDRIETGDAKAIVARLRTKPELKKEFSDDEIWAIQVSANERI